MDKIVISDEDVNTSQVDQEVRRQDIANRMAQHQKQVMASAPTGKTPFFRKAVVYMGIFGLIFSLLAWGIGEVVDARSPEKDLEEAMGFWNAYDEYCESERYCSPSRFRARVVQKFPELRDNYLISEAYVAMSKWEKDEVVKQYRARARAYNRLWFAVIGLFVAVGISIAEPFVGKNWSRGAKNAALGALLGALGGFLISLFINDIYNALQGEGAHSQLAFQQIFARSVGWCLPGMLVSLPPGILLKSGKKLLLGLAGGALGGLLGGMLFDPICVLTGSDVPARFVNIVGLGVGAAVATALLEDFAKQGWLRVATGLIAGKQFILYRNPTIIGSSPKTEIYLFKDPDVSPRHAALNRIGDSFLLNALEGSAVFVNGAQVRQARLASGDQIRIGKTVMVFESKAVRHS